jgi:hypothetical protein
MGTRGKLLNRTGGVELPYGDETHAVPICKEITLGFHVEVGLQLLMIVEAESSAEEAGSHEIIRTCSILVTHSDDTDYMPGCCGMTFFPIVFQ